MSHLARRRLLVGVLLVVAALVLLVPFRDRVKVDLTPEAIGHHTFDHQTFDCGPVIPPVGHSYSGYGYIETPCSSAYAVRLVAGSVLLLAAVGIQWPSILRRLRRRRPVSSSTH